MKKNPAVRSMLTIAMYLILLIGMWSVIVKLVYPDVTDLSRAKELVKEYSSLLVQLSENSADKEQWAGITESDTVQTLYDTYNIVSTETENGITRFYMKTTDAAASHALVYAPEGDYVPPANANGWTQTESDTESKYTSGSVTATATRLSEVFFYEEVVPGN